MQPAPTAANFETAEPAPVTAILFFPNFIQVWLTNKNCVYLRYRLPQWLRGKESTCNARATGDVGSSPGSRRSPGGGHGNTLQYSCLENPMDKGAWWAAVHRVTVT